MTDIHTPEAICEKYCTSDCHANDCEHHGRLAAAPLPSPEPLDVERLGRAYAEAGYGPVLMPDEWADIAAEYARLATEPSAES